MGLATCDYDNDLDIDFLVGDLVILAVFFVFAVSFIVRYPMLTQDFYAC